MKRVSSVVLVALGVALAAVGILFVVGARGHAYRYAIGAGGMALGGVLIGLGVRQFKQADRNLPEYIRAEILALAERHMGELSAVDIESALGRRWAKGRDVLDALEGEGACERVRRDGGVFYVFPNLLPRLAVRTCEYCRAELPLDDDLATCPSCGGAIKTGVKRVSLAKDELYSMDD